MISPSTTGRMIGGAQMQEKIIHLGMKNNAAGEMNAGEMNGQENIVTEHHFLPETENGLIDQENGLTGKEIEIVIKAGKIDGIDLKITEMKEDWNLEICLQ